MGDWVRCRSAVESGKVVWVNLEQVVCLAEVALGTEITYAGQVCAFVVDERPSDILGNNQVRDA